ncbi:MAG: pilin [Candidatus Kaiserbacteria bacterium]|nr:pilin [Candidatus Kaiserbacteria bacterium]
MRFRFPLFALLFIAGSLAVPHLVHAGIPFFGPIIPGSNIPGNINAVCPAGWGMFMTVINNIIELLITIAIVFIAPLMIAWSGFLMVVNQGNEGKITEAKKILTNTVVGIVISLAAWMIVDAIMAVLYRSPDGAWGTWSSLINSSGSECLPQKGALPGDLLNPAATTPGLGVVPSACSIPALTPITDPLAQQMENGNTVIWNNTAQNLQKCVNKFISVAGGTVTSVYRPLAYQVHLSEIRDRWCTQNLKGNSDSVCSALKSTVSSEVSKHFGSSWDCGAVATTNSSHSNGTGVDISGVNSAKDTMSLHFATCLSPAGYSGDPWHYNFTSGCTCN